MQLALMQQQVYIGQTIELVAGCRLPDPGCRRLRKRLESYFSGRQLFLKKHDIKFQLPYRMGENLDGVENTNEDEVFLQGQYVTSF